jgi:hypothetical protein
MKAKHTKLETLVKDVHLRNSLDQIKTAVAKIWSEVKIIRDHTDHGPDHSTRLEKRYALDIVNANVGQRLTSEEAYLLLAGIHLHDIGMQCDVLKFPHIFNLARNKYKANFNVKFRAKTSTSFTLKEQTAIRENHHLLSAAWIDHAFKNTDTSDPLSATAHSIPQNLVEDLIDVCKYHTKFLISDCPLQGKIKPTIRKGLVAAILRFADELDVAADRVKIETYKTFRLDPKNAVYWWLHGQSDISFLNRNLIRIIISINKQDSAMIADLVQNWFIDKLKMKNEPVLSALASVEIPLVLSHDSGVITSDCADQIVPEFVDILKKTQRATVTDALERRVVSLEDLCDIAVGSEAKVDLLCKYAGRFEETGRLEEAGHCLKQAQKILSKSRSKDGTKKTKIILAQALHAWRLAKFREAVRLSKMAIRFASEIADEKAQLEKQIESHVCYAFALFLVGKRPQALSSLREVDSISGAVFQGYTWSDKYRIFEVLVADAERAAWAQFLGIGQDKSALEAAKRAIGDVKARFNGNSLMRKKSNLDAKDFGMNCLILGRLALYSAQCINSAKIADAHELLGAAMSNLGALGMGFRPVCLESRAWLRMLEGNKKGSREDLEEALGIATQGSMIAHKIDLLLYRARLFFRTTPYPWESPASDLTTASKLIQDNGYLRRTKELEDAAKLIRV